MDTRVQPEKSIRTPNVGVLCIDMAKELDAHAQNLTVQFEANDLAAVKATLVEMKYLHSIQSTIKKKLQHLMSL